MPKKLKQEKKQLISKLSDQVPHRFLAEALDVSERTIRRYSDYNLEIDLSKREISKKDLEKKLQKLFLLVVTIKEEIKEEPLYHEEGTELLRTLGFKNPEEKEREIINKMVEKGLLSEND